MTANTGATKGSWSETLPCVMCRRACSSFAARDAAVATLLSLFRSEPTKNHPLTPHALCAQRSVGGRRLRAGARTYTNTGSLARPHTHNTHSTHSHTRACILALAHATGPHTQNMALVRINASLFQHNYNHVQLLNRPIIRLGNCTFWSHSFALWLLHETAVEGSQLAAENCRFYGPVWRNEWRPGIVSWSLWVGWLWDMW